MSDIVDDAVDFLKSLILGDFVEEQPVSAQVVGGLIALIPVVQQVMNARDVSGILFRINRKGGFAKATRDDYMGLGFAALAVLPEAGSVFKMVFKPLWKERRLAGAALRTGMEMIERMLGMAKGGAVKWIKALEWGALAEQAITGVNAALDAMQEMLEYLAEPHWWVPDALAEVAKDALPGVQAMKGKIAEPLAKGVEAIHQFVNDLLGEDGAAMAMAVVAVVASSSTKVHGKAEATAATHAQADRAASEPHPTAGSKPHPAEPATPKPAEKSESKPHPEVQEHAVQTTDVGAEGAPTRSSKPTRKDFPNLTTTIQGIVGEHIVDYHCLEDKAWGHGWTRHDDGSAGRWEVSPLSSLTATGKVNDGTHLVQLALQGPRGRGIDGLWRKKATGPEKYAVVEAKCYFNPLQPLGKMLTDVMDKDAYDNYLEAKRQAKAAKAGGAASVKNKRLQAGAAESSATASPAAVKKPAKDVMQMSHLWIEHRLRSYGNAVFHDARIPFGASFNYSRHVMLVSIPNMVSHLEAIEKAVGAGKLLPDEADHRGHSVTREFNDAEIAAEETRRRATTAPMTEGAEP